MSESGHCRADCSCRAPERELAAELVRVTTDNERLMTERIESEDWKSMYLAQKVELQSVTTERDQARSENAEWREQAFQETAEWGAETLSPIEDRLMEALQPRLDETDAAWVIQEHLLPLLRTVAAFRKDDLTFYTANESLGAEVVRLRGVIADLRGAASALLSQFDATWATDYGDHTGISYAASDDLDAAQAQLRAALAAGVPVKETDQ